MAIYCGIDLGTTNSTVSIIEIDKFSIEKPIEKLKTFLKAYIDSELWFVCTEYIDNLNENDAFKLYMYSKEGTEIKFGKIVNDALKIFVEDR